MNQASQSSHYFMPLVQNTYKQLVNGIKYTFEFEYAPTSCLIDEENMDLFKSDKCKVDETKDSLSCVVSVLDQFWVDDEDDKDEKTGNGDAAEGHGKSPRYKVMVTNCL